MNLNLKSAEECRYDAVSLGEIMLRLDPGEGRIRTAREFKAWEGGGEYNVVRGLHKCFGMRSGVLTAFADNEVGKLLRDLIEQGGVDTSLICWKKTDGIGRVCRNGLNFTERGFGIRGAVGCSDRANTAISKATPEDFAKTVLMPGDPLRAKFIAENFLSDAKLVNNVRGIQGYTGTYDGVRVSVMASGMGMPSIGIYSYELFNFFGVDHIMRIGSAGAMQKDIHVRDIVMGMGACTNSRFADQYHLPGTFAPTASYKMLRTCVEQAEKMGVRYHVGNILSSDTFYTDESAVPEGMRSTPSWADMGVMAIEMEAAALYMNAAKAKKDALAICTISDHLLTGEVTTAEERQNSFTEMMELALRTAKELDRK